MAKNFQILIALVGGTFVYQPSVAQSTNSRPTHCRPSEISYLDASMGTVEGNPKHTGATNMGEVNIVKNGKILSLCVDVENGVASRLAVQVWRHWQS